MFTFFGHRISPFSRMVQMTFDLLKLNYELKLLDLAKGEQKEEWYLKINPKVVASVTSGKT